MGRYSEKFKRKMVQRMSGPRGKSANALAKEVNVHQSTLSKWLREATLGSMASGGSEGGRGSTTKSRRSKGSEGSGSIRRGSRRPADWSTVDKLAAVVEAATLSDEELGAFLRRKGLHEAQLEAWKAEALEGLQKGRARRSRKSTEQKQIRELSRELRRKEKALAETAALLVLKKKVVAIWGDEVDNTPTKNDDRFSS